MSYSLRYRSSRKEFWIWYWVIWSRFLWMPFLPFSLLLGAMMAKSLRLGPGVAPILLCSVSLLAFVAILFASPIFRFRPKEFHVHLDENGAAWSSEASSANFRWDAIQVVSRIGDALVLRAPLGNSMVIPLTALPEANWSDFLADVREWHRGSGA